MAHRIFPHGAFAELAPGLWQVTGSVSVPVTRNMIVVRLPGGDLLLHSVVALDEAGFRALEGLGRIAWAIVPSVNHQMDAGFYAERYPAIRWVAPAGAIAKVRPPVTIEGPAEELQPNLGIGVHVVPALRSAENVYAVPLAGGGTALIFNDLLGGPGAWKPGITGRLAGAIAGTPGGRFGISRIVRYAQVTDLAAIRRFVGGLAATPDLRLATFSHGQPLTQRVAETLRAFAAG